MSKSQRTKPLLEQEIASIKADYPQYDIEQITTHLLAQQSRQRPSQSNEVVNVAPLATRLRQAFPGVAGTLIGTALRGGYNGEIRLTKGFDREIATTLAKPQRTGRTSDRSSTRDAGHGHVDSCDLDAGPPEKPNIATQLVTTFAALQSHGATAGSPQLDLSPNASAVAFDIVGANERPYRYANRFAGSVYKTGCASIGKFFDAVRDELDMDEVANYARAIGAEAGAEAALAKLHPDDRAIYDTVIASLDR